VRITAALEGGGGQVFCPKCRSETQKFYVRLKKKFQNMNLNSWFKCSKGTESD